MKNKVETQSPALLFNEPVESLILYLRGQKVMLDADLARLYGVTTKALNQAVKRNIDRFPDDFMFQLSKSEKSELVTNCDRFNNLKYSSSLPYAFTEHGSVMLASVLNNPLAIKVSVTIVRAFIRFREMLLTNQELHLRLDALESRYDEQFTIVFDAIRELMKPEKEPKNPIGFQVPTRKSKKSIEEGLS